MFTRRPRGTLLHRTPAARPGERIGLMGGSFNPPHDGHALVAETALRRLKLDQLWWLVTPANPLKPQSGLAPIAQRLEQARRRARDPRMTVTDFERELGSTYTAVTVRFLRRRFPRARFVWVMGADSLATFHRWRDWRHILDSLPVAVVDRPGWHLKAVSSPAGQWLKRKRIAEPRAARLAGLKPHAMVMLHGPLSRQSSTALRSKGIDS